MKVAGSLLVEGGGKITLPDGVLSRCGLAEHAAVRMIETPGGIFLVPLTTEPMSAELIAELGEWQALGSLNLTSFLYDEDGPPDS
jgi:bifunctional DNA-binding transcriptional regulator/antitoxin component of YhaV-PrlF toxin-antitoxin module